MTDGNSLPVETMEEPLPLNKPNPDDTSVEQSTFHTENRADNIFTSDKSLRKKCPVSWQIVRFLGFFFIGWNGLQLVFMPNFIFIVINSETFGTLLSSLFSDSAGFMPLMIFSMVTYLILMFMIHLVTEMEYRSRLLDYDIPWKEVPYLLINYGIPLFIQFLYVLVLQVILFGVLYGVFKLLLAFSPLHFNQQFLLYRIVVIFITFPWIIMQFMMDTTLERGMKGKSFSHCYRRARYIFANRTSDVFRYLLVRLTLIMLSLVCFKVLMYAVILPCKIYAFYTWDWNTNIQLSNMFSLSDVLSNVGKLIFGIIVSGILFAPIATPLYWLHNKMIRSYLNRSTKL